MTPNQSTANMLKTALACAERPGDNRLNPHLTPEQIGATIRVAIECLELEPAPGTPADAFPVYIVRGEMTEDGAEAYSEGSETTYKAGDVEWQFSDGPPGDRGSSADFATLEEGLAHTGAAYYVPWDDLK